MDSPTRAKWLASVLASFPPKPRKGPTLGKPGKSDHVDQPVPGSTIGRDADVVPAATVVEGVPVGSDGEARSWIEDVLKERARDGELPLDVLPDARQ
jgi:hypothetical protein